MNMKAKRQNFVMALIFLGLRSITRLSLRGVTHWPANLRYDRNWHGLCHNNSTQATARPGPRDHVVHTLTPDWLLKDFELGTCCWCDEVRRQWHGLHNTHFIVRIVGLLSSSFWRIVWGIFFYGFVIVGQVDELVHQALSIDLSTNNRQQSQKRPTKFWEKQRNPKKNNCSNPQPDSRGKVLHVIAHNILEYVTFGLHIITHNVRQR